MAKCTHPGNAHAPEHRDGGEVNADVGDNIKNPICLVKDLLRIGVHAFTLGLSSQIPELGWWEAGEGQDEDTGNGQSDNDELEGVHDPFHVWAMVQTEVENEQRHLDKSEREHVDDPRGVDALQHWHHVFVGDIGGLGV